MDKVVKRISHILELIAMALLMGVVFSASIDVFNRLAVGGSLSWAQQAASWLIILVIFLFAPVMVPEGGHISVVFFLDKLKGTARKVVDNFNRISLIAYSVFVVWGGVRYALYLMEGRITRVFGPFHFPYSIIAWGMPVGMFLMLLAGSYMFFRNLSQ